MQLNINGQTHNIDVEPNMPLLGYPRSGRIDRYKVRLRSGSMRRLHRLYEW